ncbi:MAG: pilus assembly protein PilP [Chromatiales bacterium]
MRTRRLGADASERLNQRRCRLLPDAGPGGLLGRYGRSAELCERGKGASGCPPFTPYRPGADQPGGGPRPDASRPKDFLERYPLDTLRMVGSIAREGSLYGLVQDPDGLIHRILPGNYLGQNDGRVTDISDGEIALVEIVPDGVGGYVERPAGLALSE